MNKIYKVIWSKTEQRYVVVSELAHSCAKRTGRTLGKSAAALMAVLALTAGVGIMPVWAVNTADATTELIDSNYSAYLDEENTITNSEDTYVVGNGNIIDNFVEGMVIGNGNELSSNGSDNLIIGNDNAGSGQVLNNSIVLGSHNVWEAAASDNIFIGNNINLNTTQSNGSNTVVVGHDVTADQMVSALGDEITASWGASVMGYKATSEDNSVSIGHLANAAAAQTVAIGYGAESHSGYGAAIGAFAEVGSNSYGLALGGYSRVGDNAMKSIAIGTSGRGYTEGRTEVKDGASYSIAMGGKTTVGENAEQSIAIGGYQAIVGDNAKYATAVGTFSDIAAGVEYATAVGYNTNVDASYGSAFGNNASANNDWATALGSSSDANLNATAVGGNAQALAANSVAVGTNSSVAEGADKSVAVGVGSEVVTEDILSEDDVRAAAWRGSNYNQNYVAFDLNSADITDDYTRGVFSVGSNGSPRRIINVGRGRISADSTDAINGSQLFGAVQYLDGRIDAVENKIAGGVGGGDVTIDGDTNIDVTETPDSATDPGTGGDTENPGTAGDNSQNFEVSMTDNPQFGGHDDGKPGHSADGSVTVVGSGGNEIALNKGNEGGMTVTSGGHTVNINKGGDGLVNGLTNTTWDWSKYEEGGYKGSDNAATESQLHGAVSGIKTEITNMGDQITNMGSQITNIGNKVGELDSRIDEVGAGAAALAALHPLDFDPDDKWDFAAGYGNYRGENAVAIGAFYRPNEDTMFSVGGTVGNDDNMVNAGVSFKIGQGNGVSTSRVAMAKEIKDLRKELEAMKSAMLDVNAGRRLDTSKLQLFPDVPQNHWAYEYVATLAGNGVIEGYPDGNFDGARPMTRYEFAAMLYKAMLNGAKLSDKILTEFAPELERFTVDVVHKDKDGNPTVERVRVVKRDDAAK